MSRLLALAALFFALLAPAFGAEPRPMTAPQLVSFIRSSVQLHQDDHAVADVVKRIKLTNRLDASAVEDLQGLGAGPRTVAALRQLVAASASLPEPPPPAPPQAVAVLQPPDPLEQKRVLAQVTQNALAYVESLPNFICTQVTRRHVDPTGTESWRPDGVIQEHLSYVDHHEDYKVSMIDNNPVTGVSHDKVGGNRSSGEFGSMLEDIFDPASRASFQWERWATLRGRRMHVFSYRILKPYSKYSIHDDVSGETLVPGYHGLVYADSQSLRVMRVTLECDDIPPAFPVQSATEVLDYDFANISGEKYLLPLKADLHFRAQTALVWNEIEFHLYRKFTADAAITFGPADDTPAAPIPEEQLQEQPAK